MAVRSPAGHAEPSLALLRRPIGEILAIRRMTVQLGCALLSPCVRAEVFRQDGRGWTMSETMGRLLAAGQRAEVFEWGSRVVKLCRSTGSKQVIFREAAINAAVEALGLPVPAVWSVQQIDGRWGIVFDRVSGVSFAEQMLSDPAAIPQRLQSLVHLQARIHTHVVDQFSSLARVQARDPQRRCEGGPDRHRKTHRARCRLRDAEDSLSGYSPRKPRAKPIRVSDACRWGKCPASSIFTNLAPGIRSATCRPISGGHRKSCAPEATRVGILIDPQSAAVITNRANASDSSA